ncbi:MAG: hypothetical protein HC911_16870 [Chloroflexaceae bacterium]|nr:hypothetical protein [Chloroflexaceae bacterium]
MILTGYVRRLAVAITPEQIIAPDVAALGDPAVLAMQCCATVDAHLAERTHEGDILVLPAITASLHPAAQSHSEHAVFALQAMGCAAIICGDVPAWWATQAAELGLPVLVQADAVAALHEGAAVRLDLERGTIGLFAEAGPTLATGTVWQAPALTPAQCATVRRYQLLVRMRRVADEEDYAG